MTKRATKYLFCTFSVLYFGYGVSLIIWPEYINVDMSNPVVEIYGLFSALLMLIALYAYAFDKVIFHYKHINLIIGNTIFCALLSYVETIYYYFYNMSAIEFFMYTSLYFIIYLPIIRSLFSFASEIKKT